MKITKRKLRQIIHEEYALIDYDTAEEVEAVEDVWSGGENLNLDIDHPKSAGGEETTKAPEILSITERQLRSIIRKKLNEAEQWKMGKDMKSSARTATASSRLDAASIDIADAIQMLEAEPPSKSTQAIDVVIRILKEKGAKAAETAITILQRQEDPRGTLFHVINRLDVALEKVDVLDRQVRRFGVGGIGVK